MKLIHLSDLHLGKRVNEFSMLEDQEYILERILGIVREEKPDGVIIAGDVYDKPVPPAEAVQLFDRFLTNLADGSAPVFIISGNHDSPERLSFGCRLMRDKGVHIAPVYDGTVEYVTLINGGTEARIYLLPFLKPAHVRRYFPETEIDSYEKALETVVGNMELEPGVCNVLVAHQFITGAGRSDSEEVSVGGLDNIDSSVFKDFDYVALGHIHRPQQAGGENMRYCGSPLKYSFSEAAHKKSVTVAEIEGKGKINISTRQLIPLHDMRELRGSYEELTDRRNYKDTAVDDYLHITLTDEEEILDAIGKLRSVYPNIMKLDYDNMRTRKMQSVSGPGDEGRTDKSPAGFFEELYELQNNQEMGAEQKEYLQRLIEDIWEGGR